MVVITEPQRRQPHSPDLKCTPKILATLNTLKSRKEETPIDCKSSRSLLERSYNRILDTEYYLKKKERMQCIDVCSQCTTARRSTTVKPDNDNG